MKIYSYTRFLVGWLLLLSHFMMLPCVQASSMEEEFDMSESYEYFLDGDSEYSDTDWQAFEEEGTFSLSAVIGCTVVVLLIGGGFYLKKSNNQTKTFSRQRPLKATNSLMKIERPKIL